MMAFPQRLLGRVSTAVEQRVGGCEPASAHELEHPVALMATSVC